MTSFQQRLPPSPPPSPPKRRHKKQNPSDPFLELSSTPLSSPSPTSTPLAEAQEPQDSLITRVIITPILFTSFLFSLFFVNLSDRRRRRAEHPRPPRILDYLSPSTWLDPEPYQDPQRSTWDRRDSASHVEPHGSISPRTQQAKKKPEKRRSWHLNKKIRKVARLEVDDAFKMRGRIIVLMLSAVVCFVAGAIMGVRWVLGRWWWGGGR